MTNVCLHEDQNIKPIMDPTTTRFFFFSVFISTGEQFFFFFFFSFKFPTFSDLKPYFPSPSTTPHYTDSPKLWGMKITFASQHLPFLVLPLFGESVKISLFPSNAMELRAASRLVVGPIYDIQPCKPFV